MLIVGENLKELIIQKKIVDVNSEKSFDSSSVSLTLGEDILKITPTSNKKILSYGDEIPAECIQRGKIGSDGLLIPPKSCVLAASNEIVKIPLGYFGFLQTKGSLARMFVSLHFSDGQVDPGFEGNITFEIMNASDFTIKLHKKDPVGNLYILKTSTNNLNPYNGRYMKSIGPTTFKPD